MPEEKTLLEKIIDEIIGEDTLQLIAGITVLAKDLSEFFALNAYYSPGVQQFNELYAQTIDFNRFFWNCIPTPPIDPNKAPKGNLLFQPLKASGLEDTFADRAHLMNFTMAPLAVPKPEPGKEDEFDPDLAADVNREWTRHVGWALVRAFRTAFADVLPNGDLDVLIQNGSNDPRPVADSIAATLIDEKFSTATYWLPFIAQLSVVLANWNWRCRTNRLTPMSM